MRSRIKLGARGLGVACVALVALLAIVAVAGAKPKHKPPFKPKTGDYLGTATYPTGESGTFEGVVEKSAGKYYVELTGEAVPTCSDGLGAALPFRGQAFLKEKAFSLNGDTPNPFDPSNKVEVKVTGHFTSTSKLVATAHSETKVEASDPNSKACSTPTLKITLKLE